jgi:hypothetical protein
VYVRVSLLSSLPEKVAVLPEAVYLNVVCEKAEDVAACDPEIFTIEEEPETVFFI